MAENIIFIIEGTNHRNLVAGKWFANFVYKTEQEAQAWIDKRPARKHITYQVCRFKAC